MIWSWEAEPVAWMSAYKIYLRVGTCCVVHTITQEQIEDDWLPEFITHMTRQMQRIMMQPSIPFSYLRF